MVILSYFERLIYNDLKRSISFKYRSNRKLENQGILLFTAFELDKLGIFLTNPEI